MNVYLDESGDLGWRFDAPYLKGGSSRYLTIATLLVPKSLSNLPKRIVKKTYRSGKHSPDQELKGKDLSREEESLFVQRVVNLLRRNPAIRVNAITVKKENVQEHIRADANKLYNYMVNFCILDEIKNYPSVDFIPDPRTIKVASDNSLIDYLQVKLWFELNSATVMRHVPQESKQSLNLQFVDFIAHVIWSRYEFGDYTAYAPLKSHISEKQLFF